MVRRLWNNLGTFLLALVLAVLVWIIALDEENPLEQRAFDQPLPVQLVNVPENMILTTQGATEVTITLLGPRLTLDNLTRDQFRVTANLAGLDPGAYPVKVEVQIDGVDPRVTRIIRIEPETISINLEGRMSRQCPIEIDQAGVPAVGYEADSPVVTPAAVLLEAPSTSGDRVAACVVRYSIEGLRENYDNVISVLPVDSNGLVVSRVNLTPNTAQVVVPITQKQGFRDVVVRAIITGQVASGYQVTSISVVPQIITLSSSDPDQVDLLPGFVETLPLDITGANVDVVQRVALQLPDGVEGAESVLVEVNVEAIEYSLTVQRALEIRGLAPGLGALPSPDTVDVLLLGPLPVLDNLTLPDVRVILDLQGLGPGTYQVEPQVLLLSDRLRAENVLPSPIEVVIDIATPTPTATPTEGPTVTGTPRHR